MYYAYGMSKHKAENKRRFIAVAIAIAVVAGLIGGYFFYKHTMQQKSVTAQINSKAKEDVKTLNLEGDQDLATAYITKVKSGDVAAAQKLFSDKVTTEKNIQKKIDLLTQNVLLALDSELTDEALAAANQAVTLRQSEDTFALAARVYVAKGDYDKQAEYWKKALDAVRVSTAPHKDQLIKLYENRIDATVRSKALRERSS